MNTVRMRKMKRRLDSQLLLTSTGKSKSDLSSSSGISSSVVLFSLRELCMHVSDENVSFMSKCLQNVPQLHRVQLIISEKSSIYLLNSLFRVLCGSGSSSSSSSGGKQHLHYLNIITKNSKDSQNIRLISCLSKLLLSSGVGSRLTLLRVKLVIKFKRFNLDHLVAMVDDMIKSEYIFKRDTMTFVIIMPLSSDLFHYDSKKKKLKKMDKFYFSILKKSGQGLKLHNLK